MFVSKKANPHRKKVIDSIFQEAKGKFVTVVFEKSDGSERVMNIQPLGGRHTIKGTGRPTPDHLKAVWDVKKSSFRSFPYNSVREIRYEGKVKRFG